jgi:hypothetical protein
VEECLEAGDPEYHSCGCLGDEEGHLQTSLIRKKVISNTESILFHRLLELLELEHNLILQAAKNEPGARDQRDRVHGEIEQVLAELKQVTPQ